MKTIDIHLSKPTSQSGEGDKAQRRFRVLLDGESVGYLTVTGTAAMELGAILSRGCRTADVDFTLHRPPASRPSVVPPVPPAVPTLNGDSQ